LGLLAQRGGTYAFSSANATGEFGGGNTNTSTGKYTLTQTATARWSSTSDACTG
jgi:hypothetical protein